MENFLIDTHCHLFDTKIYNDIKLVINKSIQKKVLKIFMPNIDLNTISRMLEIHENYEDICYPLIGLHPCYVNNEYEKTLKKMEILMSKRKYYGIGETGIDLYKDTSTYSLQRKSFIKQVEWSIYHNLPIIIHCRNAFQEVMNILEKKIYSNKLKGIFHCFTGTPEEAKKIINLGMFIGVGGILTFKNSNLKETIKDIPIKNIVLETDSPYLAPEPLRGQINEPSNLQYISNKLSSIKDITIEKVIEQTTKNAMEIYNI